MSDNAMTVGDLKRRPAGLPDDTKISFSGGLSFYRFKNWGEDEVILEFNEPQGYLSDAFKKRNPHVQVVFINTATAEMEENGVVGTIDVNVR